MRLAQVALLALLSFSAHAVPIEFDAPEDLTSSFLAVGDPIESSRYGVLTARDPVDGYRTFLEPRIDGKKVSGPCLLCGFVKHLTHTRRIELEELRTGWWRLFGRHTFDYTFPPRRDTWGPLTTYKPPKAEPVGVPQPPMVALMLGALGLAFVTLARRRAQAPRRGWARSLTPDPAI